VVLAVGGWVVLQNNRGYVYIQTTTHFCHVASAGPASRDAASSAFPELMDCGLMLTIAAALAADSCADSKAAHI